MFGSRALLERCLARCSVRQSARKQRKESPSFWTFEERATQETTGNYDFACQLLSYGLILARVSVRCQAKLQKKTRRVARKCIADALGGVAGSVSCILYWICLILSTVFLLLSYSRHFQLRCIVYTTLEADEADARNYECNPCRCGNPATQSYLVLLLCHTKAPLFAQSRGRDVPTSGKYCSRFSIPDIDVVVSVCPASFRHQIRSKYCYHIILRTSDILSRHVYSQ